MKRRRLQRKLPRKFRPTFEPLEDRRLLAAVITVNSTLDTNVRDTELTLREAILINNRTLNVLSLSAAELLQVVGLPTGSDADTIQFNIPPSAAGHVYYKNDGVVGQVSPASVSPTSAADDATIADIDPDWPHSWYSIAPTSPLPLLSAQATLDGLTQPGAAANSNLLGDGLNSVLKIEISGQNASQVEFGLIGVASGAGESVIRGLVLNRATGPKVLFEAGAAGNQVQSNYLGPDVSGTLDFPPPVLAPLPGFLRSNGVFAQAGGITIGGTSASQANLISGNNFTTGSLDAGVALRGFGSPSRVQGNLIGTDRSGTKPLGNVGPGILIDSPNNIIGGAGAGNVIADSSGAGIAASSGNNTGGLIQGNWIGTNVFGTLDLGNAAAGIVFGNSGGGNHVEGNVIAFNQLGVAAGTQDQLLTRNSIFSNDGVGIEGPTPVPLLTAVTAVAGGTRVTGTLTAQANETFRIEFYANPERDDALPSDVFFVLPGTFGEGKSYIGEAFITTDANGDATIDTELPVDLLSAPGAGGQPFVTATATDLTPTSGEPRNRTSRFSAVAALGGPSVVVSATRDTGLGTLREAIFNANTTAGAQTVAFAIPPTDPGHVYYRDDGIVGRVTLARIASTSAATDAAIPTSGPDAIDPDWPHSWYSIRPSRALPAIIDTVTIDGYSQPGSVANTLPFPQGLDTVLKIELDGVEVNGDGLHLTFGGQAGVNFTDADRSIVRGLAINSFSGDGIKLNTLDGRNTIAGNFLGLDVSGTIGLGNAGSGVLVNLDYVATIGGEEPGARNLISGNGGAGIKVLGPYGSAMIGNVIGSTRPLTHVLVNAAGAYSIDVGDFGLESGNGGEGEDEEEFETVCRIQKAVIGLGANTFPALIEGSESKLVRQLRFSPDQPVPTRGLACALSETLTSIGTPSETNIPNLPDPPGEGESMTEFLQIDLNDDGVTPNDGDNPLTPEIDPDSDEGPNGLQNYPVLTGAIVVGTGAASISGTLNSRVNSPFRIEFFSQSIGPSFRGGESTLGAIDVVTDALGNANFAFSTAAPVPAGHFITATATSFFDFDDSPLTPPEPYESSEFSAGVAVRDNPWHNQAKGRDVKPDGLIVPSDALQVIDYINAFGAGPVPSSAQLGIPAYYDVDNDAFVAPNDVLEIISFINAFGSETEAEGEPSPAAQPTRPGPSGDDWLAILAMDTIQATTARRRNPTG